MNKKKLIAILTLMCFMFTLVPVAAMAENTDVYVSTEEQLRTAIASASTDPDEVTTIVVDGEITVASKIILNEARYMKIKGKTVESKIIAAKDAAFTGTDKYVFHITGGEVEFSNIILDGNDTVRVLHINSAKVVLGNGGHITKGKMPSNSLGGGICIGAGEFIMEKGSTIDYCDGGHRGGAIYIGGGTFTMNGGIITNCQAIGGGNEGMGGAINMEWGQDAHFVMNGGEITENKGQLVGGVFARYVDGATSNSSVQLNGGKIYNNTTLRDADEYGSDLYVGYSVKLEMKGDITITEAASRTKNSAFYYGAYSKSTGKYAIITGPLEGRIEIYPHKFRDSIIVKGTDTYKLKQSDVDVFVSMKEGYIAYLDENENVIKSANAVTVTFNANDSEETADKTQHLPKSIETKLKENEFVRKDYTFTGWSTEANGEVVYADKDAVTFSEDTTLYAQWTPCDHANNTAIDCVNPTVCSECGASVDPVGHDFENSTVWINNNPDGHYKQCDRCTVIDGANIEVHNYDGHTDTTCKTCGYERSLVHDFTNGTWVTTDASYHWKVCADCDAEDTDNKTEHSYTYTSDAAAHDGVCVCGRTVTNEEHEYTNECDTDCNVCGYVRTAEHDYEWIVDKAATEYETGLKHEECTVCHATRNVNTIIEKLPSTPSTSTSSGFSGSYNYPVSTPEVDNGDVTLSDSNATEGESVTATVTPDNGYGVAEVIVTDEDGNIIPVEFIGNGQYTFVMPDGEVNIEVVCKPAITMSIGDTELNIFGKTMKNDVAPIIGEGNRTMLPIRAIAEAMGADVAWDPVAQKVTITKDGKVIEIFIGKDYAVVDGERIELDAKAFIDNNRTYLQVRFITEALDAEVIWDPMTRTVIIIPN